MIRLALRLAGDNRFIRDGLVSVASQYREDSVTVDRHGVFAVLTGYAYETVANKPIVTGKTKGEADHVPDINQTGSAPEPASLGRLARGAQGLAPWRKSYA